MKKFTEIFLIVVVAVAVATGVGIYNTPTNRINRHLDLGQKYLEEQNYEQALVEFDRAIAIDEKCIQAYTGSIEAYLTMDSSTEEVLALYDRALSVIEGLDEMELQSNIENVISIYLFAEQIYRYDTDKMLEILKRGYEKTKDNRILQLIEALENETENTTKDKTLEALPAENEETGYSTLVLDDDIKGKFEDIINACLENNYMDAVDILWSDEFYEIAKKNNIVSETIKEKFIDIKTKYENYHIYIDYNTMKSSDRWGEFRFVFLPENGMGGMVSSHWSWKRNASSHVVVNADAISLNTNGYMLCLTENYCFNGDYICYRDKEYVGEDHQSVTYQSERGQFKNDMFDGIRICEEETIIDDYHFYKTIQEEYENGIAVIHETDDEAYRGRYYRRSICENGEWRPDGTWKEDEVPQYNEPTTMGYADSMDFYYVNTPPWR